MITALPTIRKVRKSYQISLPARLGRKFGIVEGDYVQMEEVKEGIILKPVMVSERIPIARLNQKEQSVLERAKNKIDKVRRDILRAKGLTEGEARVALKAGLISSEQAWWWRESWQKKEREAEADIRGERLVGPFDTAKEAIRALTANAVSRKILTKSDS